MNSSLIPALSGTVPETFFELPSLTKKQRHHHLYADLLWGWKNLLVSAPHYSPSLDDWFSCSLNMVQKVITSHFHFDSSYDATEKPTHTYGCLWLAHLIVLSGLGEGSRILLQGVKTLIAHFKKRFSLNEDST